MMITSIYLFNKLYFINIKNMILINNYNNYNNNYNNDYDNNNNNQNKMKI